MEIPIVWEAEEEVSIDEGGEPGTSKMESRNNAYNDKRNIV